MESNPTRGCGTMSDDSFYLKGDGFSSNGDLWLLTWVLGDGFDEVMLFDLPSRGVTAINPAATIATRELIPVRPQFRSTSETIMARYKDMLTRTRKIGVGDHVGSDNYSAYSFAKELKEHGPSRKISRDTADVFAKLIMEQGPVPIMFTHSRIPLFRSLYEQEKALEYVQSTLSEEINWGNKNENATWLHDNWGQYAVKGQYTGSDHYLIPVLSMLGEIDRNWRRHMHTEAWHDVRDWAKSLDYVEQPFCLSWLTGVTYTLPATDKEQAAEIVGRDMPGVDILDLDAEEEVTDADNS